MATELNLTQEEYVKLRNQGVSKEDILKQHSSSGFVQTALNVGTGITNFLGGQKVAETFGAEIARARAKTQEEKDIISRDAPTVGETIGSGIQLGANLIPVGRIVGAATKLLGRGLGAGAAKVAGSVLTGAGLGYTFDVGRNLEQGATGTEAFKPGAGTAFGVSIPLLGGIVGLAAGKGASAASRKLEEINLRMTPVEKQNLQRKGQDIARYLSQKKIFGTPQSRYNKVNALYDKMEVGVRKVIEKANVNFSKTKLMQEINQLPDSFQNDPELQNEARNIASALVKNLQSRKEIAISGVVVQELKRNYMKRAFAKNATDVVSDTRLAIGGYFKGLLDDAIPSLKPMNKEYGLLIAANRALQKATTRSQVGLVGKLAGSAGGAMIGGAVGGPVGAAVGLTAGPQVGGLLAGTATRSALGAGLQSVSNLKRQLEKLTVDQSGNVSLKAVLNIVEKLRE